MLCGCGMRQSNGGAAAPQRRLQRHERMRMPHPYIVVQVVAQVLYRSQRMLLVVVVVLLVLLLP